MYAIWLVPSAALVAVLFGLRSVLSVTGLAQKFAKALGLAALVTLPMTLGLAVRLSLRDSVDPVEFFLASLAPAFAEEFLFRGFAFGLLFRHARWGFIPAVLLSAVAFGIGHFYQGRDLAGALQVMLVTFAGGAWLAWLCAEWETLWLPVFLHTLMNAAWFLFQVDSSAVGGGWANLCRGATIALSVALTLRMCRKRGRFNVRKQQMLVQR
ncbi:MAG: CPBP family intramembrane metalloprotease [Myxococcales bacterium]